MEFAAHSIEAALVSYCNRPVVTGTANLEPRVCRTPTVEIPALTLDQLRAASSHGLSIRHQRPTAQHTVVTDDMLSARAA